MSKDILDFLKDDVEKKFGKGSIAQDEYDLAEVRHSTSSGSFVVDAVIRGGRKPGCHLLPVGRQVEISGPNHTGKSTAIAHIIAEAQKAGYIIVPTDAERTWDKGYFRSLGVDFENNYLPLNGTTIEDIFRKQIYTLKRIHEKDPDRKVLMVLDSLGAADLETVDDEDPFAKQAMNLEQRIIAKGIKTLNPIISKTNTCYVYANHVYTNTSGYGAALETPGGTKVKFYASIRLQLKAGKAIKEDEHTVGHEVHVTALKNKLAPNRSSYLAHIYKGEGFCNDYSYMYYADELKIIKTSGAWRTLSFNGVDLKFQGFKGFREVICTHPVYSDLKKHIEENL